MLEGTEYSTPEYSYSVTYLCGGRNLLVVVVVLEVSPAETCHDHHTDTDRRNTEGAVPVPWSSRSGGCHSLP